LTRLLTDEREAHRAYIEAIRAWAKAKSGAWSHGEEEEASESSMDLS